MPEQNINPIFLNKFTKEIIETLRKRHEEKKSEKIEHGRIKKVVEVEKLKQKFSSYETKQPPQQIAPAIIPKKITQIAPVYQTIKQPAPIKIPEQPKRDESLQPSIASERPMPPKPVIQQPSQQKVPQKPKRPERPVVKIAIPPPTPVQPGEIDFGKIGFLVKDPLVTYIECPGENKNVLIRRAGATNRTQITMRKDEILAIISSFSDKARIPLVEGMLNARIGNLEISAIVSEVASSSFILKKSLINVLPAEPTKLERPMMQFPTGREQAPAMPPINRPFTPK